MRKRNRIWSAVALTAAAVLALSACSSGDQGGSDSGADNSAGESITINSITMAKADTPNGAVLEWFYSELEERSDGRITVDRTEPESICKGPEIADCVRDGRADLGSAVSDYSASLFPSMLVAGIPFTVNNAQALMAALYEVNTTNESAIAQWENVGVEYIAGWSPGTSLIGSNEEINDIEDLKGVKLRAIGASLTAAFDKAGASVVSIPAAETYEAIDRGIADAVAWTLDGAVAYKLTEQLSYWTDPGAGAYTTVAMWMNKDFYAGLPEDLRAIVDEVRDELNNGAGMEAWNQGTESQCTELIEFSNTKGLSAWSESATEEWKDLVQKDLVAEYVAQAEADGLADAQGYFDDYVTALESAAANTVHEDSAAVCIERFADR